MSLLVLVYGLLYSLISVVLWPGDPGIRDVRNEAASIHSVVEKQLLADFARSNLQGFKDVCILNTGVNEKLAFPTGDQFNLLISQKNGCYRDRRSLAYSSGRLRLGHIQGESRNRFVGSDYFRGNATHYLESWTVAAVFPLKGVLQSKRTSLLLVIVKAGTVEGLYRDPSSVAVKGVPSTFGRVDGGFRGLGTKGERARDKDRSYASHKLSLRDILAAIAIFTNGAKGYSALQLSRDLCVQYKTAFVMAHKLREAMAASSDRSPLSGTVEVDGAYFGGHVQPSNEIANRRDLRKKENQSGKRQVVVVMREREGRALPFVTATEAQGVALVHANVSLDATVHTDEASHWDNLSARYPTKRINHSEAYSLDDACTNQAESFFSRLRRAEIGTHHHVAGDYLNAYANEMAWRENFRRVSNGEQYVMIVGAALSHPVSRQWKGYWQRG